jgi:uncharacterized PurR-regulated membrane protein YhhQ (DUF165 family)
MRTTVTAAIVYALAMTLANLSIAEFGKVAVPINAFLLIGLDLALRDWLHFRIKAWQMAALISFSGALTFALNPAAGHIAIASACAFMSAALADWAVFSRMRGSWMMRANGSNVAGALVDSIVFPAMAFGGLDPLIVAQMFVAKVAGGAMWAYLISKVSHTQHMQK